MENYNDTKIKISFRCVVQYIRRKENEIVEQSLFYPYAYIVSL